MLNKIITLIAGIIVCYVAAYFSPLATQHLQSETKAALEYTPNEMLENNGFVALLAITAPPESDYLLLGKAVASRAIKQNTLSPYNSPDGLVLAHNIESTEQEPYYLLPCYYDSASEHCISDILANRPLINWHLNNNSVLLERYQAIIKLSVYENNFDSHAELLPRFNPASYQYNLLTKLSDLRIAEAVIAIVQAKTEQGLQVLEAEISFYRRILAGKASLAETEIATRQLMVMYRVISELIATQRLSLKDNGEQINALIKPLSDAEQQALAYGFELARNKRLAELNELSPNTATWKALLFYDKAATLNAVYVGYQFDIDRALLTKPVDKREPLNYNSFPKTNALLQGFERTLFPTRNLVGTNILKSYLNRLQQVEIQELFDNLYNLNSYLYLVNAQVKMMQIDTTSTEVAEALKELGDLAKNPYTGQDFTWKKTTSTLSFPNFTKGKCCYPDFEVLISPLL